MFIPFIIWFILLFFFSSALINATAVRSQFLICKARLVLLFEKLNARSVYICSCVYSRMSGLPGKLAARWRLFPQALDTFPCTTTRHTLTHTHSIFTRTCVDSLVNVVQRCRYEKQTTTRSRHLSHTLCVAFSLLTWQRHPQLLAQMYL